MADTLIPSPLSALIADEVLEQRARDDDEFGAPKMHLEQWALLLAADVGKIAQLGVAGDVEPADESPLRDALVRLACDAVSWVEQIDFDSGRADLMINGSAAIEPALVEMPATSAEMEHEPEPPSPADDNAAVWSGDKWRSVCRSRGVRVADAIRHAQELAAEAGVPEPGTLDGVSLASAQVAQGLRAWVEAGGR